MSRIERPAIELYDQLAGRRSLRGIVFLIHLGFIL